MIVTHNIGILAARLKLTALSGLSGGVIYADVCWKIEQVKTKEQHISHDAQPVFQVAEGDYTLIVTHQNEAHDLGGVFLEQNTETDIVVILSQGDWSSDDEYVAEYDEARDFHRRQAERDQQTDLYGSATLPLRETNPEMQGELSNAIQGHPLLRDSAQFDGVPPDYRPDPSENESAARLTYEKQLQNQLGNHATPTPSPVG